MIRFVSAAWRQLGIPGPQSSNSAPETPAFQRRLAAPFVHTWLAALGILSLILVSEIFTAFVDPFYGMLGYGCALAILFLRGAFATRFSLRRFYIVFSLVPLIRILGLALPFSIYQIPMIYWYLVIGLLVYFSAFIAARLTGMRGNQIGWSMKRWPLQLLFVFPGILLGFIEFLILSPATLLLAGTIEEILIDALILIVFTGLLEEIIFRGMLQTVSMQVLGKHGLLFVASIFAFLHIGYFSLFDFLFVFFVGWLFGWLVWKRNWLLGVSVAHGATNVSLYLLFPLLFPNGFFH